MTAGKLASQVIGAYDAAIYGCRGISMYLLQSALRVNLLIGVQSLGGKGRKISSINKLKC